MPCRRMETEQEDRPGTLLNPQSSGSRSPHLPIAAGPHSGLDQALSLGRARPSVRADDCSHFRVRETEVLRVNCSVNCNLGVLGVLPLLQGHGRSTCHPDVGFVGFPREGV